MNVKFSVDPDHLLNRQIHIRREESNPPQGNAWIEFWFRILKYDWLRYKDYVNFDQIKAIIRRFIVVYNLW